MILEPSVRRREPAVLVAAGVQVVKSSWSDQAINIGSMVPPVSAPNAMRCRSVGEIRMKLALGELVIVAARVPIPTEVSQVYMSPPRTLAIRSSPHTSSDQ